MKQGRALFVAYAGHLKGHGGVQVCTADFMSTLAATGLDLEVVAVQPDRRISTRVLRRVNASPYFRSISPEEVEKVRQRSQGARFVFLNQMNLAGGLKADDLNGVAAVGLSHGCEITDQVHLARLAQQLPLTAQQLRPHPTLALARTLRDEIVARRLLWGTIAISPFDADCERWLGTPRVCWIPRTIMPRPLERHPVMGRFGTVGTLDHAPNLEGITAVLDAMQRSGPAGLTVRVVGGPPRLGQWLAARFSCVEYLGPLNDDEAAAEARTWNGFLHPIFCLPRGCSTKLAGALAWGLPVITTPEGRRGYRWTQGGVIETETPQSFVAAMRELTNPAADAVACDAVKQAACSSPSAGCIVKSIQTFLGLAGNLSAAPLAPTQANLLG